MVITITLTAEQEAGLTQYIANQYASHPLKKQTSIPTVAEYATKLLIERATIGSQALSVIENNTFLEKLKNVPTNVYNDILTQVADNQKKK